MRFHRRWLLIFSLPLALPWAALPVVPAAAQQTPAQTAPSSATSAKPKPTPAAKPAAKPASSTAAPAASAPAAKPAMPPGVAGAQPKLLGQYAEWGAYMAAPGGKKICFAIAKPQASDTVPPGRPRNPAYIFISTRPAEKVTNEVSIVIGYPFKPSSEATAAVGSTTFALYTQQDGAWIKNAADEASMVNAMRTGQTAVVKGVSAKGTQSSDTFNLKGLSQALDRTGQECK